VVDTSEIRRRVAKLESEDRYIRSLLWRMLGFMRGRKVNHKSRALSDHETDRFRQQMAEHGMDDETPDPKTTRQDFSAR
jgi:hypothetical protein